MSQDARIYLKFVHQVERRETEDRLRILIEGDNEKNNKLLKNITQRLRAWKRHSISFGSDLKRIFCIIPSLSNFWMKKKGVFFLNVVNVHSGLPEAGVARVFSSRRWTAGSRYSDWLGLRSGLVLTLVDQHHAHIHANVAPLQGLAYLQQGDCNVSFYSF